MAKLCKFCGERISGGRKDKQYCDPGCRAAYDRVRYARPCDRCNDTHAVTYIEDGDVICALCGLYDQVNIERQDIAGIVDWLRGKKVCVYCGEAAEHVEHVMPRRLKVKTYTVPSCAECNLMAGGKSFEGIIDKGGYIKDKIRTRYAKLLMIPEWSRDEIDELSGRMRGYVEVSQRARMIIRQRLEWDVMAMFGVD